MLGVAPAIVNRDSRTVPLVQENFFWVKSIISTGYNGEQSVAGFLPVQGGTVVVCLAHATLTDRE